MLEHLRNLMAHAAWADGMFCKAWGESPAREQEELRRRFAHLIGVESGFVAVLKGEPPGSQPEGPPPAFSELTTWARHVHGVMRDYAGSLHADDLSCVVHIPWFPDPPCLVTIAEALVQVAMHSQHHRGQLMTRLKDFGGAPVNVDWIIWLWKGKPNAEW